MSFNSSQLSDPTRSHYDLQNVRYCACKTIPAPSFSLCALIVEEKQPTTDSEPVKAAAAVGSVTFFISPSADVSEPESCKYSSLCCSESLWQLFFFLLPSNTVFKLISLQLLTDVERRKKICGLNFHRKSFDTNCR